MESGGKEDQKSQRDLKGLQTQGGKQERQSSKASQSGQKQQGHDPKNSQGKDSGIKQKRLSLYRIDMKYVRDLHHRDDDVRSVSPQIGKNSRVFIGVIVICGEHKYCVPLSHPKGKYGNMKGRIDFSKILDEKGKVIAGMDFNLMIPVENTQIQPINMTIHPNDKPDVKHYKRLCQKEVDWCQKHQREIVDKANVLYNMYMSDTKFSARERCLDFPKLEKVCKRYNEKLKEKK